MEIITTYNPKPGPDFRWDWEAVTDSYDGADDCCDPIGWGATEEEAIKNLKEQLENSHERINPH